LFAVVMMTVLGILFFIHAPDIVRVFFNPEGDIDISDVVQQGTIYFRIMIIAYPAVGVGMVLSQAFAGAGATKKPVILDLIGCWIIQLPLVWVIIRFGSADIRLIWWAVVGSYVLLSVFYILHT